MTTENTSDVGLVRVELEKILSSQTFGQSEGLKRFLRHVVVAKLEGREQELKELSLGTEVFDRGDTYDPRIDPIVRVQATRLRSKLRDYYLAEGAGDEMVIELPKGSYVPSFLRSAREPERVSSEPKGKSRRGLYLGVALFLGLLIVGLRAWFLGRESATASPPSELRSLAILPFTDMSPEGDHQYYGDGLADEVTTRLASVEGLDVVPRTSAFRFRGVAVDLNTIATELDADAILQGSLRRSGDTVRVQVQLIRGVDGWQIWAETYDRPASDAFQVQEEIARAVARSVERELVERSGTEERYAPDPAAYEDYLRGTFEREKNTPPSIERSIRFFDSAIVKDPDFAPAHAGLVQSYVSNLLWGFAPPSESLDAAREASERALALAGDHPEALAAAALFRLIYQWDLEGAGALVDRGSAGGSDPEGALHLVRGVLLAARGSLEESSREIDEAIRRERHRPAVHHLGAAIAFHRGDYEDALGRSRAILEWAPDHPLTWLLLSRTQDRLGLVTEGERSLATFERSVDAPAVALAYRAVLLAHGDRSKEARAILQELLELGKERYVSPALLARSHSALGEVKPALDELEKARKEKSFSLLFLRIDPDFEPLRSEPSYRAFVEKLGLIVQ